MASNSLINFASTLTSEHRKGKIFTRKTALQLCLDVIKDDSNILTLPSIAWEFEKMLLKRISTKSVHIHSFEYNYKLFSLASIVIPRSRCSSITQTTTKLNYCKISAKHFYNTISIHNTDVFDFLQHTKKTFDFMWIDLTSPIDHVRFGINTLNSTLSDNGVCILSFLKGRERIKIKDRVQFVADILTDFDIIDSFEYTDTVCMINVILKKKINYESLIAL